jgi:hypothetical protein
MSMKRINPATNLPFKFGDVREDGYLFRRYKSRKLQSGYQAEQWYAPDIFKAHREKNNQAKRATYHGDLLKHRAKSLEWYHNNKTEQLPRLRKAVARWKQNNKATVNAGNKARQAAKLYRTPKWLNKQQRTEIVVWYRRAQLATLFTGTIYHVDHIVPLLGKSVCGLHVPWNLQLLTAFENVSKGNRWAQ